MPAVHVRVIATPPARRRPIRTFLAPYDPATVRTALDGSDDAADDLIEIVGVVEDVKSWRVEEPAEPTLVFVGRIDPLKDLA